MGRKLENCDPVVNKRKGVSPQMSVTTVTTHCLGPVFKMWSMCHVNQTLIKGRPNTQEKNASGWIVRWVDKWKDRSLSFREMMNPDSCVCVSCTVMSDSVTQWTEAHQAPLSKEFSRQV